MFLIQRKSEAGSASVFIISISTGDTELWL